MEPVFGQLIKGEVQRDAIHIACVPVVTIETLVPGQFIVIGINYSIPHYIQNYAYENQGRVPDLMELKKEHREYMLKNMFSDKGYKLTDFDWNSLNPKEGYYLCYYRHVGQNQWVYNFDIFEYDNDYGYWTNFKDNQSYKRENIMSFLFLESL